MHSQKCDHHHQHHRRTGTAQAVLSPSLPKKFQTPPTSTPLSFFIALSLLFLNMDRVKELQSTTGSVGTPSDHKGQQHPLPSKRRAPQPLSAG